MRQPEQIEAFAALADFRRAQSELERVMRERPEGEAGRLEFETALRSALEAGDKMQEAARKLRH